MVIEFVLLVLISCLVRLIVVRKTDTDFDTYGHLYFAKEVAAQKCGPFGKIKTKVIGSTKFGHPFLWHWLVGLFSFKVIYNNKRWINALLDAFFSVIIFYSINFSGFERHTAYLAFMFYLFTPMWFSSISTGPRIRSLTPRITSEFSVNFYFMCLILPLGYELIFFIAAIFFGVYTLLSSKFGIQALVFLSIVLSLITVSFVPVGALLLSLLAAILLTKGEFLSTFKHQILHLKWYFKKNIRGEMSISERNSFKRLKVGLDEKKGIDKIAALFLRLIKINSFTSVILKMPVLILSIVLFTYTFIESLDSQLLFFLPIVAAIIVYILINIPALLFLGEAERYLNHVAFFIVSYVAITIEINDINMLAAYLVIGYGVVFWLFESLFLHKLGNYDQTERNQCDDVVIDYLQNVDDQKTVLTFPYHSVGVWRIMLETHHRTVFPYTCDKNFLDKFEKKYSDSYPYFDLKTIEEFQSEFGLDLVIMDRTSFQNFDIEEKNIFSEKWNKVPTGDPLYSVYKRA